jgi:hypothetical protein
MDLRHRASAVRDIDEEDRVMGLCSCSGRWRLAGEAVVPVGGRWLDRLHVACESCSSRRLFVFDITAFFAPRTRAWTRPAEWA